ncbi:ABC transporter B family member 27 [Tritrichomonas foetus]|uniref:ABC transporter B family member 27 n=1 Tax=Tritrichomonas foetus TaxID=1144522 RepID=A0A1J4KI10_9EUKA|nr:ABC transporter B family member 27 [Tritrichomonas foetus]|eukprot:OHT10682.1 ABC transporter B family member 27 [Tritrichomonas foetus]
MPGKRRGRRNQANESHQQTENLLNDVGEVSQQPRISQDKHRYIPWLPKIYWFFYRKPVHFLLFLPNILTGSVSVASDLMLAYILDAVNKEDGLIQVKKYAFLHFLIAIGTGILNMVSHYSWSQATSLIRIKVQRVLFKSMLQKDVEFFDENSFGDLENLLHDEVNRAINVFSSSKGQQVRLISSIISSFSVCFALEWRLSLFSIVSTVAISLFVRLIRTAGRNQFKAARINNGKALTIADETIANSRTVFSFNRQKEEIERFSEECGEYCRHQANAKVLFNCSFNISTLFDKGAFCVCLNIGGFMVLKKIITPGLLFALTKSSFSLGHQIAQLLSTFSNEQQWLDAANKLFEVIDQVPKVPYDNGRELPVFTGNIEFRDVWFKYPTRNSWVLKNVSFKVNAGEMAAFVGHSGSGKSTILQLILRFYDVNAGQILLDGVDIKGIDPRWIHRTMSVVQQEPVLFSMSIRDNVIYGIEKQEEISEDAIDRALEIANAAHFVSKLPMKKDTLIGEKGSQLSGGQKQRIAIARAVIRDPIVLITDEATSALDSANERKVQIALDGVMKGRTSIIIAHRLGTIKNANIIHVFDSGELVESGTHDELIEKRGTYYTLIERQLNISLK